MYTGKKFLATLCTAASIALCGTLKAQTINDFGTWVSIHATKSWGKPFITARLEHRSFKSVSATECYFGMIGGGYALTPWLKADAGYEFWKIPSAGDATFHKATLGATGTLKKESLAVSIREKYELSFNAAGGSPSGTLRSRLRAQYSIPSSSFTPYVMYEHFQTLSTGSWQRSLHYVGTEIKLGGPNILDVYYMYHLFPSASGNSSCHVLGLCYMLVF